VLWRTTSIATPFTHGFLLPTSEAVSSSMDK
jgi:hypothetical protein